ncbi:PREDICTED: putative uncharacterized protein FLJ37770 [Trachymyrmex septentrionalis]|uniref:putative uncharacterized protein FLJ37770 n=1 Tax=Trachymyrmex septentrionalis TaxID=34720 RepID=UPI00084F4E82|nr:PREDICTED: putative uncharacterized protein FLJ37770 [Trachymyrmex septentrionalis]
MKGKTPQETKEKLGKHYGDCAPSIRTVYKWFQNFRSGHMGTKVFWGVYSIENASFEWHKAFSEGREVVENLSHASRPSTSVNDDNMEKVKEIVLENRRVGIREIAEALNISYGSTQHILVNVLDMKRIAARLVPKDLNFPA